MGPLGPAPPPKATLIPASPAREKSPQNGPWERRCSYQKQVLTTEQEPMTFFKTPFQICTPASLSKSNRFSQNLWCLVKSVMFQIQLTTTGQGSPFVKATVPPLSQYQGMFFKPLGRRLLSGNSKNWGIRAVPPPPRAQGQVNKLLCVTSPWLTALCH